MEIINDLFVFVNRLFIKKGLFLENEVYEFSERFKEAMKAKGIEKAYQLSKKYEFLSPQLANNFFAKNKTITKAFAQVCEMENINIHWIATGKGEMFINENKTNQQINGNNNIGNINNSSIKVLQSNDKEMQEILQDLCMLPDNKRKKIHFMIKAELTDI